MEPLNTPQEVRHFLQFGSNRVREIAEPLKFDAANFVLKQKEEGLGRDVSFASGTVSLTFDPKIEYLGLTHLFDDLITEYNLNGFEAEIKYILKIDGEDYVIGQLDFKDPETDELTYFDCKVIEESDQEAVYRRENIKVNLLSSEDKDGNYIFPLETEKMYLRATPIFQKSEWEMPFSNFGIDLTNTEILSETRFYFNPFPAIIKSGVESTLSPLPSAFGDEEITEFVLIEAKNTITKGSLIIEGLNYKFDFFPLNNFPFASGGFYYWIGSEYVFGDATPIFETGGLNEESPSYEIINGNFTIENLTINRGEKLILFFQTLASAENQSYRLKNQVTGGKVKFSGVSTSISSTIRVVKYGEALQQVIKSISGLEIDAPRFLGEDAEFASQYITDGLRIRNVTEEPFNISLEELASQLQEWRGDFEITPDKKVFFGIYRDFYTEDEIGDFTQYPNEIYKKYTNELYAVNTFELKYSSYENGNDEDGSREGVHTELQMLLPNKGVNNTKNVNIGFVRDSFEIESTRKNAILVSDETATDSDGKIFIIDGINKNISAREDLVLKHLTTDPTELKLLNDNSFNWLFSGMQTNDFINIEGQNSGTWLVVGVEKTVLTLQAVGETEASFNGEALITLIFNITTTTLTNRTNEGFTSIVGTSNPEGFSNLRFTPKRNILNYWRDYLLTACSFRQSGTIRMTDFVHNKELETFISGNPIFVVKEGQDISVEALNTFYEDTNLTPFEILTQVRCDFFKFWTIKQEARKKRGFISILNNKGERVKIYPKELDFNWEINLLTITGELKKDTLTETS